jgi:hypothetical protein
MEEEYKRGQKLEVEVIQLTDLGLKVAFGDGDEGLIYYSETDPNHHYRVGESLIAQIEQIRDDGKIDLTLNNIGYKNFITPTTNKIMQMLKQAGGSLPYHDKSDPDEIREVFGMSKTKFKQAIGKLYKEKKIKIHPEKIELV